jgi:quercetin dioxygenase-like cupin family protein
MNLGWFIFYFIFIILFYIYFIKLYFNSLNNKLFYNKICIKKEKFLWGHSERWTNNKIYVAKNIFLRKKSLIAKHYHKFTIKTIYVVSGELQLFVEKNNASHNIILVPGEAFEIYPETIYSISAATDVAYIEISSHTTNDNHSCKREKK